MSLGGRRQSTGPLTPNSSRVRQAFKSPFRSPVIATDRNEPKIDKLQENKILKDDKESTELIITASPKVNVENNISDGCDILSMSCDSTPKRPGFARRKSSIQGRYSAKKAFKTPFRSPVVNSLLQETNSCPEDQLTKLKVKEAELDVEIEALENEGYSLDELQGHIDQLHKYNDIKDAAQLVMGKLADIEGVSIREMHERYGVSFD